MLTILMRLIMSVNSKRNLIEILGRNVDNFLIWTIFLLKCLVLKCECMKSFQKQTDQFVDNIFVCLS